MLYLIGQIIGAVAMIESFFIYQAAERKKMVALKLVDDLLWVTHFIMIGGYAAAMTTGVAIFREIIFYEKKDKKWADNIFWPIVFSVVFAACAIPNLQSVFGFLPSIASIAATWAFWLNDVKVSKIVQLPTAMVMLAYDIAQKSYSGTITQILTIISVTVYFFRAVDEKKRKE